MRSHDKDTGVGAGLRENYFVWSWAGARAFQQLQIQQRRLVSLVAKYANVLWRKLPVSGTEPVESVPGDGGSSSPTDASSGTPRKRRFPSSEHPR